MSGKHSKDQSTVETDFEAAQKGIEFDQQWQESFDRAEQKREDGIGAYAPDKRDWAAPKPPERRGK